MIPPAFEYVLAASLDEAVRLLRTHGSEARLLAGGHSLVPLLKLRLASPRVVIDIGRVPGLAYVREASEMVLVGALTTHADVASNAVLQGAAPVVAQAAACIGDVQVRNCGTIGGSLAHAHPAADLAAAVLALEATVVVEGPRGRRCVGAAEFFHGPFTTTLETDEIVAEVRIPRRPSGAGAAYQRAHDQASHFAVVGVAAVVEVEADGTCRGARIGVTGLADCPFRGTAVEAALTGKALDPPSVAVAVRGIADGVRPLADVFASSAYRAHLARVYAARAVLQAAATAVPAA